MSEYPYETWMGDIREHINDKRLSEICILGTHDSGAYNLKASVGIAGIAQGWANAQEKTITEQLYGGVRCLDLRFMYIGNDPDGTDPIKQLKDIVIVHTKDYKYPDIKTFTGENAEDVFGYIVSFLGTHRSEIVVVGIELRNATENVAKIFFDLLKRAFDKILIADTDKDKTYSQLIKDNKRIGIRYRSDCKLPDGYTFVWHDWDPDVSWAQTTDIADLFNKEDNFIRERKNKLSPTSAISQLYEAKLQFTATLPMIVEELATGSVAEGVLSGVLAILSILSFFAAGPLGPTIMLVIVELSGALVLGATATAHKFFFKSIRDMAKFTNPLSYLWIQTLWERQVNIFSLDYFDSSNGFDFMKLVLRINKGEYFVPKGGRQLQSGDSLNLHSQAATTVGAFEKSYNARSATDQYYPTLSENRPIELKIFKCENGSDNSIKDGDEVFLVSQEQGLLYSGKKYDRLGAWSTPALYYYKEGEDYNDNETWVIHKYDKLTDNDVHYNDLVYFTNKAYKDQCLVPHGVKYMTTQKSEVPFYWWMEEYSAPQRGAKIQNQDSLSLQTQAGTTIGPFEKSYNAKSAADQYYPTLSENQPIKLKIVKNADGAAVGSYIKDGDEVFLISQEKDLQYLKTRYDHLGAWSTPALYYYKEGKNYKDNETWIIRKQDTSTDNDVHYNDLVYFTNKAYKGQYLVPHENKYLTTQKSETPFYWRAEEFNS